MTEAGLGCGDGDTIVIRGTINILLIGAAKGRPHRAGPGRESGGSQVLKLREPRMETLLLVLDLVGTFVFALSGAIAGIKHRLDLFGVLVLSFAAGNAGGITRDRGPRTVCAGLDPHDLALDQPVEQVAQSGKRCLTQARRDRRGAGNQPLDCRSAWRAAIGRPESALWRGVSLDAAGRGGTPAES